MNYRSDWIIGKHSGSTVVDLTEDQIKYKLLQMFRAEEKTAKAAHKLNLDLDNLKFTGITTSLNEPFSIQYKKVPQDEK